MVVMMMRSFQWMDALSLSRLMDGLFAWIDGSVP